MKPCNKCHLCKHFSESFVDDYEEFIECSCEKKHSLPNEHCEDFERVKIKDAFILDIVIGSLFSIALLLLYLITKIF